MAQVVLKNIRKPFGAVEVIKGIDLTVEDGEICVFVGVRQVDIAADDFGP